MTRGKLILTSQGEMPDPTILLKELRDSAEIQLNIFTQGSCFRLYRILKLIYPSAVAYWSDRESHCITKIGAHFYDIGGEINASHLQQEGYYPIPEDQMNGYALLKYHLDEKESHSVNVSKYV
jgi:hypothetical protein